MPMTNQYLAFGTGGGANTYSYATYNTSSVRSSGYQPGLADAQHINTVLRQCSVAAAGVAKFAADYGTVNVVDDGSPATFEAALKSALDSLYIYTPPANPELVKSGTLYIGNATEGVYNITFSTAFPTSCTQVLAMVEEGGVTGGASTRTLEIDARTRTGFSIRATGGGIAGQFSTINWRAFGT